MNSILKGLLVPAKTVTPARQAEMFRLFEKYYENADRNAFQADLAEKHWVILLVDAETDELCGFSTQMLLEVNVDGEPIHALFSGDTIISRDRWGDVALSRIWGRLALSLVDRYTPGSLYWFLISKGYKTYRFLPLFFHEFYPRHDLPTPDWARRMIDAFAQRKFPHRYDAKAGIVRADRYKDRLRRGIADVTPERLRDPHVRFFEQANAGHAEGDELCCLATLSRENFTRAAYRAIGLPSVEVSVGG